MSCLFETRQAGQGVHVGLEAGRTERAWEGKGGSRRGGRKRCASGSYRAREGCDVHPGRKREVCPITNTNRVQRGGGNLEEVPDVVGRDELVVREAERVERPAEVREVRDPDDGVVAGVDGVDVHVVLEACRAGREAPWSGATGAGGEGSRRDETCPLSTEGWARRVQLVREGGGGGGGVHGTRRLALRGWRSARERQHSAPERSLRRFCWM